ncbi:MAG: U32 family peptidase [Clostridiales bacterium]|nr:U32 family peptidase [Clostridiales bacterium]
MIKPEILSPAGDRERLEAALMFGADAVYLGSDAFTMRAAPQNFPAESLRDAVDLCHKKGVKVYLTVNTLPRNNEIETLPSYLQRWEACGVDAFIVADVGVLGMCKKFAPSVNVHISTQAGVVNFVTANEFYNMGASRIVTARELSLDEIAEIRAKTPEELEIECFVHGAMCVSFSGRCLLSNYLINRDANRGQCAQPCRWEYALMEKNREGQYFPIDDSKDGTYILNSKDMCMIEHIPELIKAGVSSFKIEGRAKSAYYAAVITNAYRCAVDAYMKNPSDSFKTPQWIIDECYKVSYRDYCTGFYFGAPSENAQISFEGGYIRHFDVVAAVTDCRDGYICAEQRNKFSKGDILNTLEPGKEPVEFTADELFDADGNKIDSTPHPMMTFKIKSDLQFPAGTLLRKAKD